VNTTTRKASCQPQEILRLRRGAYDLRLDHIVGKQFYGFGADKFTGVPGDGNRISEQLEINNSIGARVTAIAPAKLIWA